MTAITRNALRHRKLVVLAWIVVVAAGVATLSSTTGKMTHTFATPGTPGYTANHGMMQRFGIDGNEQPTIAVLRLPPGQSRRTAAGPADAARPFAPPPRPRRLAPPGYA